MILPKIYCAITVVRMTYVSEGEDIDKNNMELEKAHRHNTRIVQGVPNMVHKLTVRAFLGWISMKSYIALKICFLFVVHSLSSGHGYIQDNFPIDNEKWNANEGDVRCSPIADTYNTFCRYDVKKVLMSRIQYNKCYHGDSMDRVIKIEVKKHEFECWVTSQFMYPELHRYYKGVKDISIHFWWLYAAKNPRMTTPVSSAVSLLMVNQHKSPQCNCNKQTYSLCHGQLRCNVTHILYECPELVYVWSDAWSKVLASVPSARANQIDTFSAEKKLFVWYLDSKTHTCTSDVIYCKGIFTSCCWK